MIPRCFHWIWVGDAPLPAQHEAWMAGWARLHPDWDRRLWTEANRPALVNEAAYEAATVASHRADILSYEILLQFGGVFLDTDMECLRSIDELLEDVDAFVAAQEPDALGAGIMGASRRHPWAQDLVASLSTSIAAHEDILESAGPRFLTRVTQRHPEVKIFPPELFYPYLAHEPSRAEGPFPDAYAVHRWHGSWVAPEDRFHHDYPRELERELRSLIPTAAKVLTLAEGIDLDLGERPTLPFVQRDGYWGHPESNADALGELERLRSCGWSWLVLLQDAYWWFDSYPEFMAGVQARATAVHRRPQFIAFDLSES